MSFKPKSEWIAFTPTGTFNTNCTYTGRYMRIGDSLRMKVQIAFSGATNSTSCSINFPTGLVVDTSKLIGSEIGRGWLNQSGGLVYDLIATYNTSSVFLYAILSSSTYVSFGGAQRMTEALPNTIANSDVIEIDVTVPIIGW